MRKSIDFFCILLCFVDMSKRQDILRVGRETMIESAQADRKARRPPVRRRRCGRSGDGEGTCHPK